MQRYNLFTYNNYNYFARFVGLTFLAAYLIFCLACISSNKQTTFVVRPKISANQEALNINLATSSELEKLPKIGKSMAEKIISHREKYGKFRQTEHLISVKGMSDKKFREIQNMIKVE
jgi:competence ComEA-like helix-hairpin-helix protein